MLNDKQSYEYGNEQTYKRNRQMCSFYRVVIELYGKNALNK